MEDNPMTFEEYLKEELKYCDEYEPKNDVLEAHSNDMVAIEIEYQE
tara:strand:+ start:145 stop:282 length:138 start_codon:yes stop_codon:yes gene_type:complete